MAPVSNLAAKEFDFCFRHGLLANPSQGPPPRIREETANEVLSKAMHEKRDTSKWLFDCTKCHGKFETRKELDAHLARKLFKCPFKCPQKFTHKAELVWHEKTCPGRIRNGNFDNYKIYQMM